MEELVGKIWDRMIRHAARHEFPRAAVRLADVVRPAGVLFRALGGDGGLRITAATAAAHGARRRWRERLAGTNRRVELAWRDGEALYLPDALAAFPRAALNRDLYLWLAALAALDDGRNDSWFFRNQRLVRAALARFPGLAARYARLLDAHLALRPDPARLPDGEAAQERALRAALADPGGVHRLPPARRAPAPVLLWLRPDPPRAPAETAAPAGEDPDDPAGAGKGARDRRRRHAARVAMPSGRDSIMLYRFENMFSFGEYARLKRGLDEDDGAGASRVADDLDVLHVARGGAAAAGRVRFDLDLPAAANDDAPLGAGVLLPEWDYRHRTMKPDHCRVQPMIAARAQPRALPARLARTARRLRRQFELLAPARAWVRGLPDGAEPDLDAYLRFAAERSRRALCAEPNLYRDQRRARRDLSCLLLADLSLSTDAWVSNSARVIDVVRDALYLFAEALSAAGDRFALHGFSSRRREHVRFHHLKGFGERYGDAVRGRIEAIRPGYYTRLGAAIRHATQLLAREQAARHLLLILTDGKPNDLDLYEGRYGVEDTRQAVLEARRAGLVPFCVTIDDEGADYLPHMFGAGHFVVIREPSELPRRLPRLYARLTQT
jgi:nitric oxide reductase NorD protein